MFTWKETRSRGKIYRDADHDLVFISTVKMVEAQL